MNSLVLAGFLGTVTFLLLHLRPDPYLFSLVDSSSFVPDPEGYCKFYQDLNSDEKIEDYNFANISDSASCLLVRTSEGVAIEQWNFKGKFSSGLFKQINSDYDHDGKTEISIFTMDKNRLYLNIIEPYDKVPVQVKDRLIDTIWTKYSRPLAFLYGGTPTDLNHDGSEEIIFSFSSGYARQPRKVYAFDIKADSLWSSPYAGSFLMEISSMDIDRDGKIELTGRCDAPNNYIDESIELRDNSSWFIVLDEALNFKVPPKKMGPIFSQTVALSIPFKGSLDNFVFVSGYKDSILIFDWYRMLPDYTLEKRVFDFNPEFTHPYFFTIPAYSQGGVFYNRWDKVLFINTSGKCFTNRNFSKRVVPIKVLNPSSGLREFEYCFLVDGKTLKISFFSLEGKELGSIGDVNYSDLNSISWARKINGRHQLFLAGNKLVQWYEVRRNPWQYFQYLVLIGLIGGFYGFIELVRFSQAHEISKREGLRREILELQLKTVKNQLDPHFTFNALNGLSYLAMSGDTVKVSNFINHFSRLLRTQLHTSDQTLVKLRNEIDFLDNYMQLQRIRFDDQIKLELEIHPDVDTNLLVPKMILQTHVENAVKHGLQPKLDGTRKEIGIVKVSVFNKKESTIILIEDNGVGRGNGNPAKEESTGRGLQVLDQIFSSVKLLYKLRITQDFEDLKNNEGKAAGTRVKIVIN